jgi:hypothetical protein
MDPTLRQLLDKESIKESIWEVMARYARGVDRADWDEVRRVYHPDAYDDHGDYKGGIDGFIDFARTRTGALSQCMHFLGNSLIEFASDDVAVAETYFVTAHTLSPEGQREYGVSGEAESVQLSSYGRNADRFERGDEQWRIARRIVIFEATRVVTEDAPPLKPDWAQLRRDANDPVFLMRREAGLAAS